MKTINRLAVAGLALLALCSCGTSKGKNIRVTGQNGAVYESYQEACTAQDFMAAHMYLDRMRAAASSMPDNSRKNQELKREAENRIDEAIEYITNKEILLLMSLDDETAYNRITFLLKENDFSDSANDSYCETVIDLAIDMDKPVLVQRMTNFYKGTIRDDMLKKIVEYLYVRHGDENLPFVTSLLNRYDKNELLLSAALEKGDQALAKSLLRQRSLKLTDEKISLLASFNDKQFSDIILQSLAERSRSVPSMPSISGYVKSSMYGKMDEYTPQGAYNIEAKQFNDECVAILNLAIASANAYLAKGAIGKMKPTLQFTEVGDWCRVVEKEYSHSSLYNAFRVSLCYDDINAAKQSLKTAF